MHNMENTEHLHGSEMMSRARESDAHTNEAALTHARVAGIQKGRERMLASLIGELSEALLDALRKKIAHEYETLSALADHEARLVEKFERANRVLPSAYFVRKRLEAPLI